MTSFSAPPPLLLVAAQEGDAVCVCLASRTGMGCCAKRICELWSPSMRSSVRSRFTRMMRAGLVVGAR
ncbi:hypothetical protein PR003_g14454 [Phytophthora rubi]|uniref:Uncharacterized protein n=1 Tax=Phytophthora rubi TaxID=129364 RepID=A0A6A3KFH7_9STRA|nr:hypothetical protein PR001_g17744 [Phytophthora rubi]KAE9009921.1 hypothetical protein PR002_g15500 [Phytophthora rubi]KAE9332549.1 hypothetical protein PR003_g14454 [Phytophthora rubi]